SMPTALFPRSALPTAQRSTSNETQPTYSRSTVLHKGRYWVALALLTLFCLSQRRAAPGGTAGRSWKFAFASDGQQIRFPLALRPRGALLLPALLERGGPLSGWPTGGSRRSRGPTSTAAAIADGWRWGCVSGAGQVMGSGSIPSAGGNA